MARSVASTTEFLRAQRERLIQDGVVDEAMQEAELERRIETRAAVVKDIGGVQAALSSLKHTVDRYQAHREEGLDSDVLSGLRDLMKVPFDGLDAELVVLSAHLPPLFAAGDWASELVAQVLQTTDEASSYMRQVKETLCPELLTDAAARPVVSLESEAASAALEGQKVSAAIDLELMSEGDADEVLERAFAVFDADDSGTLSAAELQDILTRTPEPGVSRYALSEADAQEIIREVDVNGDGQLSISEFIRLMKSRASL